jgi:serine/threonine kinase PknH
VAGLGIWQLTRSDSKSSKTPIVDLSKLDVGHYDTKPRRLSGSPTKEEGRYLEAFNLAEGIVDPYDVDPILDRRGATPTPYPALAATAISGNATPVVQPVLEKYGMISGYTLAGYSIAPDDFVRSPSGDMLALFLASFPNGDAAAKAAAEMDAVDFAVNPQNQHATIPGYPQAKAHFWPPSRSIVATMASGKFVAWAQAFSTTTVNLDYLIQRLKRVFDLQTPLMSKLFGSLEATLTLLPLDPDNMLSRTFIAGDQPKISGTYWSIGPRAAIQCADGRLLKEGLFGQAGIDRCSFSADSQLLRAKDETAATMLLPKVLEARRKDIDHDVAAPDGLANAARCFEYKQEIWAEAANARFTCFVTFGRYVARVRSNEQKDVGRRAAAQYAILVNSA